VFRDHFIAPLGNAGHGPHCLSRSTAVIVIDLLIRQVLSCTTVQELSCSEIAKRFEIARDEEGGVLDLC
jgi:hypothetical protein